MQKHSVGEGESPFRPLGEVTANLRDNSRQKREAFLSFPLRAGCLILLGLATGPEAYELDGNGLGAPSAAAGPSGCATGCV